MIGLLDPIDDNRLGTTPANSPPAASNPGGHTTGALAIMNTRFFETIDFEALFRREIPPPFTPGGCIIT